MYDLAETLTDPDYVDLTNVVPINSGYKAILADPPWQFETYSEKGRQKSTDNHYHSISLDRLKDIELKRLCAKDCILFLWVVDHSLEVGLQLMEAWGFTYKTVGFTWVKTTRKNKPEETPEKWHFGLGYWTRANPEMCLLGTIGKPKRKAKNVRQLMVAPVREHSRKPDDIYKRIESLVDGPYLELFSRTNRPGWDSIGTQKGIFNE